MHLLTNGYFQDGLKAFVYFVPLVYIIIKRNQLKLKYFWPIFVGLLLLFLGHVLDFTDEFKAIKYTFIIGKKCPMHDLFEDMIGFTLGFGIFITGIILELKSKKVK